MNILPEYVARTFDQLPYSFFIREKETTKFIYANLALAKLVGLNSPTPIINLIDEEIPASLFDNEISAKLWKKQVKDVSTNYSVISLLEIHPNEVDYPYITKKFPFYNEKNECIGMAASGKYLEVYSPNDFVKGKLPGSTK